MAIDAIISRVDRNPDGTATLHLRDRPDGGCAGQSRMTVLNPTADMEGYVGAEVWGGDVYLMHGNERWAERVGYTRLRLLE